MQVLGDLIRLPEGNALPLPWWQRAPLGLLHGTPVYVGLVESSRPVGDIVVSVLDINKWDNILRVECTRTDRSGVLADLMEAVHPLNIALAETVTTETGTNHHATLFCEDKGAQSVKDAFPLIDGLLRQHEFRNVSLELPAYQLPVLKSCQAIIRNGLVVGTDHLSWFKDRYASEELASIDLTNAVVSADTDRRLLRYVFPRQGARTVSVVHADKPGALREIFREFAACDLNLLSALLRRGGQQIGYAELIAVAEAEKENVSFDQLRHRIGAIDQVFDASISIRGARRAKDVLYLERPETSKPASERVVVWQVKHPRIPVGSTEEPVEELLSMIQERFAAASLVTTGLAGDPPWASLAQAEHGILLLTGFDLTAPSREEVRLGLLLGELSGKLSGMTVVTETTSEELASWATANGHRLVLQDPSSQEAISATVLNALL